MGWGVRNTFRKIIMNLLQEIISKHISKNLICLAWWHWVCLCSSIDVVDQIIQLPGVVSTLFDSGGVFPNLGTCNYSIELVTLHCKRFPVMIMLPVVFVPHMLSILDGLVLKFDMVIVPHLLLSITDLDGFHWCMFVKYTQQLSVKSYDRLVGVL